MRRFSHDAAHIILFSCLLAKAYCQDNTIHKASDGDCVQTPVKVNTTVNPVHGSEVAFDIFCTDISYVTCGVGGTQVCATDGKTYANM